METESFSVECGVATLPEEYKIPQETPPKFKAVPPNLPDDFWVRLYSGAQKRVWIMNGQMKCLTGDGKFMLFTEWAQVKEYQEGPRKPWIKV